MFSLSARTWLVCVVLLCAALTRPGQASAQSCHMPSLSDGEAKERPVKVRATVATSYATYATSRFSGEYQGLMPTLDLSSRYVRAEVSVPMYRIVRNGLRDYGVGDVAIDARAPIWSDASGALALGAELSMTLPTGDADKQLGMGHAMLMPGAFLTIQHGKFYAIAQVAYGRALSSGEGAHAAHRGSAPVVNPMNRSEVEHALAVAYLVLPNLRATGRLYGATPVAVLGGAAREAVGFGGVVTFGPVDVGVEVHLPLAGTPFSHKSVATISAAF